MRELGLSFFIAMFSAVALNAQVPAVNPKLAIRSGVVEVQRGDVWLPVSAGEQLNPGERIRTAKASSAALEIGTGKIITLTELSQVRIGESNGTPIVELENGSMRVFAASEIQVAVKDTRLESVDRPQDRELGSEADRLNPTVFTEAVRSSSRPYGRDSSQWPDNFIVDPTYYFYPVPFRNFVSGHHDPNEGKIVPPTVNNPTNPGYRPTQIVPPMSDPIRVPVTKP